MRGRDIKRYEYSFADQWLICTHNGIREKGVGPINIRTYPAVKEHLDSYWEQIQPRADQGVTPYNLRNCAYIDDFYKPKIIWAELARTGNAFTLDEHGYLLLNTCYILTLPRTDVVSLKYLLAVLNSKAILFYMDLISSKLDVTGWRWLKQFVESLPVPVDAKNQIVLSDQVNQALSTRDVRQPFQIELETKIDRLIYDLFELSDEEICFIEKAQRPARPRSARIS